MHKRLRQCLLTRLNVERPVTAGFPQYGQIGRYDGTATHAGLENRQAEAFGTRQINQPVNIAVQPVKHGIVDLLEVK